MKQLAFNLCFATLAFVVLPFASLAQTSSEDPNAPEVIAAVAPVFPPIARAVRAKGDVVIDVSIEPDGTIHSTKIVSGHVLLQKVSEAAAKKWKFAPSSAKARSGRVFFGFGYIDGRESDPEYTITFKPPYRVDVVWNPPPPTY